MAKRLSVTIAMAAFIVSCGGPQKTGLVCGQGTSERDGICIPNRIGEAEAVGEDPVTEPDSAEADANADIALAGYAAQMCECRDTECALRVAGELGQWSRANSVALTKSAQQSARVYLGCVARIGETPKTTAKKAHPAPEDPSVVRFKTEYRAVRELVEKLERKDAKRASEPKRLLKAVETNYESALTDANVREAMMTILSRTRSATEKRLERR